MAPMSEQDLKSRTKAFALRAINLGDSVPNARSADVIARQLIRAATSVGANYRAARRARSHKDFVNKLGIVEEEADECCYWLELLADSGHVKPPRLASLQKEADELTAIIVASIRTAKRKKN